jgi:transmembrane sensor
MTLLRTSDTARQAAEWVVQLRAPDRAANCEQAFADWLRVSPVHVREYLYAVQLWEGLGHAELAVDLTSDALVHEAISTNLVRLPGTGTEPPADAVCDRAPGGARCGLMKTGLSCALLTVAIAAYLGWRQLTVLDVATGVGEQHSTVLPDHSLVELNTQSEIRVAFTSTERRVELVRGEAFFDVSKDPARPFIVYTDVASAKAVGTRFSVYRALTGTIVTVAEGRVLVRHQQPLPASAADADHPEAVEVVPGTQAEARPGRPVQMHSANLQQSLAWRERRLVFDGAPLEEVVKEFNRYNSPPLVIADPRLNGQRISGVFGANDSESLLDFLVKMDHVTIHREDTQAIRIGSDTQQSGESNGSFERP